MADAYIKVIPNGPYRVNGPVKITDPQGNEIAIEEGRAVSLCRCGGSSNKPYCDGTHSRIGFQAAEAAVRRAEERSCLPRALVAALLGARGAEPARRRRSPRISTATAARNRHGRARARRRPPRGRRAADGRTLRIREGSRSRRRRRPRRAHRRTPRKRRRAARGLRVDRRARSASRSGAFATARLTRLPIRDAGGTRAARLRARPASGRIASGAPGEGRPAVSCANGRRRSAQGALRMPRSLRVRGVLSRLRPRALAAARSTGSRSPLGTRRRLYSHEALETLYGAVRPVAHARGCRPSRSTTDASSGVFALRFAEPGGACSMRRSTSYAGARPARSRSGRAPGERTARVTVRLGGGRQRLPCEVERRGSRRPAGSGLRAGGNAGTAARAERLRRARPTSSPPRTCRAPGAR